MTENAVISRPSTLPEPCVRLLARARRRAHGQTFSAAVLRVTGICLGILLLEFLLDYYLSMPVIVRAVVIVSFLALSVRVFLAFLVRPLSRGVSDEFLAHRVEDSYPAFRGTFITAVQLSRPGNPAAAYVSASLVDVVEQEAAVSSARVNLAELLPARCLAVPAALCVSACLAWAIAALSIGDALPVWRSRLFLGDTPWPRSVMLAFTQPVGPRALVASGDDLLVEVTVERGKTREVELVCDWGDAKRIDLMTGWGERVFRHTLANVTRPCTLFARGGDGRTPVVNVVIVTRPRIERIATRITYPSYTGVPVQESEDGNVRALAGSTVAFTAWARPPVAKAAFRLFASGAKDPGADLDLPIVAEEGGSRLEGSFSVAVSGSYVFTLTSTEGFVNETRSRYRVVAIPDQVPRVAITAPAPTEECTREAEVTILGSMTDDWGMVSARFVHRLKGPEARDPGPDVARDLEIPAGAKEVPLRFNVELGRLSIVEGSTVYWRVEATDAAGGVGKSAEQAIVIVRPEDMRDILFDRLGTVREEIRSVAEAQEKAQGRLRALERDTSATATLGREAASPLAQARADEMNISRRLEAAADEFARIRERMVRNMVGDLKEQKWVGSLGEEARDLADAKVESLAEEIGALADRVNAGNASPAKLAPLIGRQREIAQELRDMVDRMTQFGDLNQLVRQLQEVLSSQVNAQNSTRELMGGK
jgi:hypothetical protein